MYNSICTYLFKSHHVCVSFVRQTNKNDRATRGASACAARAIPQIINQQSTIVDSQSGSGLAGLGLYAWRVMEVDVLPYCSS